MVYLITSMMWIATFLLLPKYKEEKNIWSGLITATMVYECYLCLSAGIMLVVHIPVDIYTISIWNLLTVAGMIVYMCRIKKIQRYYIKLWDTIFLAVVAGIIAYLMVDRFTVDMKIIFQTIDPSAHLITTMDFVNRKAVGGMYVSQMINGLMIEALGNIFTNEFVYKSYIIQYGLNFFMAAAVFWAVIERYNKNIVIKILGYVVTIAYVLGYPYNDMLYGFTYLQMTVTLICYMILLMQDYLQAEGKRHFWMVIMSMSCLAVSVGYTLFAPPVYVAVLICMLYKNHKEKVSLRKQIIYVLEVFLVPSMITLYSIFVAAQVGDHPSYYNTASLVAEGEAYRNLYSDFLLFSIPAIYGIIATYKKRKVTFLSFFVPIFGLYYIGIGALMMLDRMSTYYFYKLNYVVWMLVLILFLSGMDEIYQLKRSMFGIILGGIVLLSVIYTSGIESVLNSSERQYLPYADSGTFFRVYTCNKEFRKNPAPKSDSLVEICGIVDENYHSGRVAYIGYWENLRWYDALTYQNDEDIRAEDVSQLLDRFYSGEFGEYAVVEKGEGLEVYQDRLTEDAVYENDFGYIIKR